MKKRNKGNFEERQRKCMVRLVRDILSDKSIAQISFETTHGAISVTRAVPETSSVHAIGFTADYDEYEDNEEDE